MLDLLTAIVLALVMSRIGLHLINRLKFEFDPLESIGLSALIGFGTTGLIVLFVGLKTLNFWIIGAIVLALSVSAGRGRIKASIQDFELKSPLVIAILLLLLFAGIGVLAPSDMKDWDSLAYHFAVPKIWAKQGHVGFVPAIHHSNFPFTAEMLTTWMFSLKDTMIGAKTLTWCWTIFGAITIFGLTRRWFGTGTGLFRPAPIATLIFLSCPIVMWESSTGYIDVIHGLFCGLAILYAAEAVTNNERDLWIMSAIHLGFALGTKHTGLQILFSIFFCITIINVFSKGFQVKKLLPMIGVAGIALAIACPWYIKSVAYTGNPVYPFFYKSLGGKEWDSWRSAIYTVEQKSFGVGTNPMNLGHAVLGLAYQPGRYVNPNQTVGGGFPTGSIGFVAIVAGLIVACAGSFSKRERAVLSMVGLTLCTWFVLSQQSRYLTCIVVPLAVLGGGILLKRNLRALIVGAVILQSAYSTIMLWLVQTREQLPVIFELESRSDYETKQVAFSNAARTINALPDVSGIVLYDEVFGYFLDKPYIWGNPGHSTRIPYDSCKSGADLADALSKLGYSHVYINLSTYLPEHRDRWLLAIGENPYSPEEKTEMKGDPNLWCRWLLADAVRTHQFQQISAFPSTTVRPRSLLFRIQR